MPIDESRTAQFRWLQKPVLASRLLDDMEQMNNWTHHGQGKISLTAERAKDGKQSIRLQSPTKTDKPNNVAGRPFGEAVARRNVAEENWSDYNRLSFWVYPHLPGFHAVSLLIKLHNDGAVKVPDSYGREGLNYFLLKPDQWNQIVWEIPHLARDRITAVDFIYRLQGNEPGATNVVTFDLDHLELQRVEADHYQGWNVAPGHIAFSHSGYQAGAAKTAIASKLAAKEFQLVSRASGKVALTKPIQTLKTALGEFQLIDFSEVRESGMYLIRAGDIVTALFAIDHHVWTESIWKTINFFYCQRCGIEIPGIHGVCHRDWRAVHNNQRITINGGWHDAGDLSQGIVNTAEAAYAMFALADRLRDETPELADRLINEARWGLDWVHKTRFGAGFRVIWGTMDFWTDGVIGTADDMVGEVRNSPFENFVAVSTEAIGSRVLKSSDPALAEKSLKLAREDWEFAVERGRDFGVELASAGALAAVELFKATGESAYANKAHELARIILECQRRELPDEQIPLNGFFYTHPNRERIQHYFHRGHEQGPIVALTEMCAAFPEHPDWMKWYSAVVLHSEYLKAIAQYTEPYGMAAAAIYSRDESNEPSFREQVLHGIKLSEKFYLRRFPVWFEFRGNHGTVLSQAKALSSAAQLRHDLELAELAQKQLEWVVGRNPFSQSTMFGEGYDYAPQYTPMSGDMVGSLPVGIQTKGSEDQPYWPSANCYNYKEVWVHPSARWLWIMSDLAGSAIVSGQTEPNSPFSVEFEEMGTHQRYLVKPDGKTGQFVTRLPEGNYLAHHEDRQRAITILPAARYHVDLQNLIDFSVSKESAADGRITIRIKADGEGSHRFNLRAYNLTLDRTEQTVKLSPISSKKLTWSGQLISTNQPWSAVIVPDGNLADRREIFGVR